MDKNMINIDDLVRQRLSGGEAQGRSGAWLQMRDLLDDKMPVRPAASSYNWRRMLTATTGLLLLASLTVGSYKMYTNFRTDSESVLAENKRSANHMSDAQKGTSTYNTPVSSATENENNLSLSENDGNKNDVGGTTTTIASTTAIRKEAANDITGESEIKKNDTPYKSETTRKNNTSTATKNRTVNNTKQSGSIVPGSSTPTLAGNNTLLNGSKATAKNIANTNTNAAATVTNGNTTLNEEAPEQQTLSQQEIPDPINERSSLVQETEPVKQENAAVKKTTMQKDSIPKIAVTEKMKIDPIRRSVKSTRDTTSISKMAVDKTVENNAVATANKGNGTKTAEIALQANAGRSLNDDKKSSENLKMKSQKTHFFNAERFSEMVNETKYRLGQVKFHSGILFGINNYMYNTNSMMGIQIGLRGVAVLDEKWSLFAELKYMQRFNKNYTVQDNYWKVNTITGNEYSASEIEHFFKFSALHTLEMPVAVRYALMKQLHVFVGANLVYNIKINAEEITHISEEKTYTGTSFGLPYESSVKLDDFGARLSAGWLVGLSYQLSPTFDLDARITRNLWDNAAGSGPRKISDQLLYRPSLQFSIGYKFPQRNKIPPAK